MTTASAATRQRAALSGGGDDCTSVQFDNSINRAGRPSRRRHPVAARAQRVHRFPERPNRQEQQRRRPRSAPLLVRHAASEAAEEQPAAAAAVAAEPPAVAVTAAALVPYAAGVAPVTQTAPLRRRWCPLPWMIQRGRRSRRYAAAGAAAQAGARRLRHPGRQQRATSGLEPADATRRCTQPRLRLATSHTRVRRGRASEARAATARAPTPAARPGPARLLVVVAAAAAARTRAAAERASAAAAARLRRSKATWRPRARRAGAPRARSPQRGAPPPRRVSSAAWRGALPSEHWPLGGARPRQRRCAAPSSPPPPPGARHRAPPARPPRLRRGHRGAGPSRALPAAWAAAAV